MRLDRLVCLLLIGSLMQPVAADRRDARVFLDAHNCYPDNGRWTDRLTRALATGVRPVAIEQDLVWVPATPTTAGRSVLAHDVPARGDEPTLDSYFFATIAPIVERALAEDRRDAWPLVVLHLDFKTNEREHHEAIWQLLGRYQSWLTTAERRPDGMPPSPLAVRPLLVLTENGEGQERDFNDRVAFGSRLRLFGTVPSGAERPPESPAARADGAIQAPADRLIPSGATSYRRWTNHSWWVVERGGAPGSGQWTTAERARLRSLVARAHDLGLWIRFYTLNGHAAAESQGWSEGYNFGGLAAARERWRAAIDAGVDFLATDQYEAFARELAR